MREGGTWDEHEDDHGAGEEAEDEDHAGAEGGVEHEEAAEGEHRGEHEDRHAEAEDEDLHVHHEDGHEHHGGEYNLHLWLDPANAAVIAGAVADALSRLDPEREGVYRENEAALQERLLALDEELTEAFAPVADRGFIVFHDAWQYLDTRYGLRAVGSVTADPDRAAGAARLAEIRRRSRRRRRGAFSPSPSSSLAWSEPWWTAPARPPAPWTRSGPGSRTDRDLYFDLMRANVRAFRACFGAR